MKKLMMLFMCWTFVGCVTVQHRFGYDLKKEYPEYADNNDLLVWSSILKCENGDSLYLDQWIDSKHEYIGQLSDVIHTNGKYLYVNKIKYKNGRLDYRDNSQCFSSIMFDKNGVLSCFERNDSGSLLHSSTYGICNNRGLISKVSYLSFDFENDSLTLVPTQYPFAGVGYWIDYYYIEDGVKSQTEMPGFAQSDTWTYVFYKYRKVLKEEGPFHHNYRYGKWKFYNRKGELTHTKIYKIQDRIHVISVINALRDKKVRGNDM